VAGIFKLKKERWEEGWKWGEGGDKSFYQLGVAVQDIPGKWMFCNVSA